MPTETLFRSVLVVHEGERYRIVHRSQAEGNSDRLTPLVAQSRLESWMEGPAGNGLLRLGAELLGWSYSSPQPLDAERLLREVLQRELEEFSGSLVVLVEPATHFQPLVSEEVEVPEYEKETEEDHWIEIHLVDEIGEPVRGKDCEIKLPDGKIKKRRTNNMGVIYLSGIDPGNCEISFTRLDEAAWEQI